MNEQGGPIWLIARLALFAIVFFSAVVMSEPTRQSIAAPICLTVAVAGLACSCRPGPPGPTASAP